MNPNYPTVAERANFICEYCRAPEEASNFVSEVEHIIPVSQNGVDDLGNLALACRACNVFKANFLKGRDENGAETERLFNPRLDRWNEHFQVNLNTLEITGTSEIGRGTVYRLRMNSERQLRSRRQWHRFGLFP